jgi:hypothetical protein
MSLRHYGQADVDHRIDMSGPLHTSEVRRSRAGHRPGVPSSPQPARAAQSDPSCWPKAERPNSRFCCAAHQDRFYDSRSAARGSG